MFRNTALTLNDAALFASGLGLTLLVFTASFALGSLGGLGLALLRERRVPVLAQIAFVYVELFRNSPLLVQLFLIFFGLPSIFGISLTPLAAGLVALGINTAAFMAVIIQSAIEEVPRGQWEAARSSGLNYGRIMIYIVAPQAVRAMIPPTIGLAVGQLQVSSLVSIIGVIDLTKVGGILNLRTQAPYLVWSLVGAGYFVVSKPLSLLADWAEARLAVPGTSTRAAK